jgi:WD40 repeat protein
MGAYLAAACTDNAIRLWQLFAAKPTTTATDSYKSSGDLNAHFLAVLSGFQDQVSAVDIIRNESLNQYVVAGGSFDSTVRVWELSLSSVDILPPVSSLPYGASVRDVMASAAVSSRLSPFQESHADFEVLLQKGPASQPVVYANHKCKILSVALHNSSKFGIILVSSSEAPEKNIVISSLASGSVLYTFAGKSGHTNNITSLVCIDIVNNEEFNGGCGDDDRDDEGGDNTVIVSGGDRSVRLWSLKEMKLLRVLEGHRGLVTAVNVHRGCIHGSGNSNFRPLIISGSIDNSIRMWSMDGALLRVLESPDSRFSGSFAIFSLGLGLELELGLELVKEGNSLTIFSAGSSATHSIIVSIDVCLALLYPLFSILYSLSSILYSLFSILYSLFYSLFSILYSLFSILYSLSSILYSPIRPSVSS